MSFVARCDFCQKIATTGATTGIPSVGIPDDWFTLITTRGETGKHWCGECDPRPGAEPETKEAPPERFIKCDNPRHAAQGAQCFISVADGTHSL